jgi:hypothetical protein
VLRISWIQCTECLLDQFPSEPTKCNRARERRKDNT